jgi:type II secretory pathway pseudopilin PulG
VAIISILATIVMPRMDIIVQRAHQSKARSDLGYIRTAIGLYYSDNEGKYPLMRYPQGNNHYVIDGLSLSSVLSPRYIEKVTIPQLFDRMSSFNGLSLSYDDEARAKMTKTPPEDSFIVWLSTDLYTPLLDIPFGYDNRRGALWYANGNYDTQGNYFYEW